MRSKEEFEELIVHAIKELPDIIQKDIDNVEFILEEGDSPGGRLLGLYHGIPQTKRGNHYSFALPDKIIIYKKTIERHAFYTGQRIEDLVKRVVWHEIGHYFGYSEPEIRKLEQNWRNSS